MSYFDEPGGDQVAMSASAFGALSPDERATLVTQLAQQMAPTVLARVEPHEHGVELVGRYGVHAVRVCIDGANGALTLHLRPRRRLLAPPRVVQGGPQDPSRELLAELPHGTSDLLNRLLDSFSQGDASLSIEPEQLVLALLDPERMLLSTNPAARLQSVTHLCAYIASEAETRWPEDANAPLTMPKVEPRPRSWHDLDGHQLAPPVPGYGMPPGAGR